MKILHTSDLHLGKNLLEESFYEDQKYILNEIRTWSKDRERRNKRERYKSCNDTRRYI